MGVGLLPSFKWRILFGFHLETWKSWNIDFAFITWHLLSFWEIQTIRKQTNAVTWHVMTCTADFFFVKPNEKVSCFTTFWYLRVRKHIVAISQWFVTMAWCGHPERCNMVKQRQQSHFAPDGSEKMTTCLDMRGSLWMDWGVTLSGYRETKPFDNGRGKFQVNEIGTPSTLMGGCPS